MAKKSGTTTIILKLLIICRSNILNIYSNIYFRTEFQKYGILLGIGTTYPGNTLQVYSVNRHLQ